MSVVNYCCDVQRHVRACKPDKASSTIREWFGDTGRASRAVTAALECKTGLALRLAEPLAEKYDLP